MNAYVARGRVVIAMLSLAAGACGAGEAGSRGDDDSSGLDIRLSGEATAADAGLPAYPGAKPYKEEDSSSSGGRVRLSTSLFGIKVVAMNLQTGDEPARVAKFYRQALSKYGDVLECSDDGKSGKSERSSKSDDDELTCEDDDPGSHSVVYKVGTKKNQRIVAIKPHDDGTRFSLVHVDIRGD